MAEPSERELIHDPRPGRRGPMWLGGEALARLRRRAERAHARAIDREDLEARLRAEALLSELGESA